MGEYATRKSDGQKIKIGTCENMYYLRYDQREQVRAESGNVDPVADAAELRFRFSWPDEDTNKPGDFDDYGRSLRIDHFDASTDVEHSSVQFSAHNGYLVSLPCPEAGASTITDSDGIASPLTVHKNGYGGAVHLCFHRFRPEVGLVPILKCGGCGAMWRIEDRDKIESLAVALRSDADHMPRDDARRNYYHTVADRVLAGVGALAGA